MQPRTYQNDSAPRIEYCLPLGCREVETEIVSEQLGHSTTRITEDFYLHVSVQMQIGAAETTVALLPERKTHRRPDPAAA